MLAAKELQKSHAIYNHNDEEGRELQKSRAIYNHNSGKGRELQVVEELQKPHETHNYNRRKRKELHDTIELQKPLEVYNYNCDREERSKDTMPRSYNGRNNRNHPRSTPTAIAAGKETTKALLRKQEKYYVKEKSPQPHTSREDS